MKRKLWTFGDSFTESFSDNDALWVSKYVQWKGYVPKVYPQIISEEFDLELKNMAKGGWDNYSIFESICNSAKYIGSDDIIIVGWSSTTRFRLVNNYGKWKPIIPNFDRNDKLLDDISKSTIDEILVNRQSSLYANEVKSWINLLDYTFKSNTIIHWSPLDRMATKNFYDTIALESIKLETNGEINDGHFSEKGHIQISNILMSMIRDNRKMNII